jgi:4-carboxymuconolactone decarboxylase
MSDADLADQIRALYTGRGVPVPSAIEGRIQAATRLGRLESLEAVELVKRRLVAGNPLGAKLVQMLQFSQLLALGHQKNAGLHARAAMKEGASLEELAAVSELSLITGGLPAYVLGMDILAEIISEQP